jgi:hypothetical protein
VMKGWKKGEIVVKREEIFKLRERERVGEA